MQNRKGTISQEIIEYILDDVICQKHFQNQYVSYITHKIYAMLVHGNLDVVVVSKVCNKNIIAQIGNTNK